MDTIHKLDRKKQADYRTALLGLAADQPASAGVCPTSAEMAELAEKCPLEKKEMFFRHIAVCETCYREWLTLQEVLDIKSEARRKPMLLRLLKPGNMAFFGTLLAAAASVVLFLNINLPTKTSLTVPVESIRQEPSPPPVREEEKPRPVVQKKESLESLDTSVQSAPKPEPLRKKQQPVSPDAVKTKKPAPATPAPAPPAAMPPSPAPALKTDLPATPEQALPKAAGETGTDGEVRSQAGGRGLALRQYRLEAGAAVFVQWREQLENGCREGKTSDAFWQEMEQKGREVKARSGELQPEEQRKLEILLLAIAGMEKKNVPEQCRKILDLLAEERKGR